jgi:hypothetical protein
MVRPAFDFEKAAYIGEKADSLNDSHPALRLGSYILGLVVFILVMLNQQHGHSPMGVKIVLAVMAGGFAMTFFTMGLIVGGIIGLIKILLIVHFL